MWSAVTRRKSRVLTAGFGMRFFRNCGFDCALSKDLWVNHRNIATYVLKHRFCTYITGSFALAAERGSFFEDLWLYTGNESDYNVDVYLFVPLLNQIRGLFCNRVHGSLQVCSRYQRNDGSVHNAESFGTVHAKVAADTATVLLG